VRPTLLAYVLALAAFASPVRADGYFSGTTGARAAGRAGAFTARADDLSAVTHNPAGLAHLEGPLLQLGNRFSYNAYAFGRRPTLDWGNTQDGIPPYVTFAEVDNTTPLQLLEPFVGIAAPLGLPDFTFALSFHAPAGSGRMTFPSDGAQRYMMVRREAVIVETTASAAYAPAPNVGLGASLRLIHVPSLRYQLVIDGNPLPRVANPVSSELDMLATIDGSDPITFSATLGAWWRPAPFLEVAISGWPIPADVEIDGTLAIDPVAPEIEGAVALRRNGTAADDVRLILPLPLSARAGVRYRGLDGEREVFDVELDVLYEAWSRVDRFRLDSGRLTAELRGQRIDIGVIDIEKRWRDTLGVQLGGDYVVTRWVTVRGGLLYASAVGARRYAHVDFASGAQLGGALGASLFVLGAEIALAYQLRHQLAVHVSEGEAAVFQEVPGSPCEPPYTDEDSCHPQYLGRPAPAVNAGEYRAHSHALSLDVLYAF
jgi:long-subunit fatty acid transport protein